MKSRNEIGPSRSILSRSLSARDTVSGIIGLYFAPVKLGAAALALLVTGALSCAAHRDPPLPTLEDYSDGVSNYAAKFLERWTTGTGGDGGLYASGFRWSGPLPGDSLSEAES